ncbi:alpha/beta hydrolase family protein [Myceligenerans xiligouense]|uniref:Cutinase n=1 Tax=Myceligenerans xiligouense TaxID=253184 RepID=A0A3N4ZHQ3_9MICO|nr:alpha/beta hydrolase [Myceligenerans xiligouense]RPF20395.1 cutinase [Myceligenerans xiligouense]
MQSGTAPHHRPHRRRTLAAALAAAAVGLGALAAPAQAADNPYERGPNPTESSIEATRGYYSVSDESVSSLAPGFGGGTIYYPTTRTDGTFGAVAVVPGYTASESTIEWLGARVASQGFVVFTIDTDTRLDQPRQRGDQLLAALDYLTERSDVADRVDPSRLAVMGHSMGGGGTLEAAKDRPSLKAIIPMTPWNLDKTWGDVEVPMLDFGAEYDTIASPTTHAKPFYNTHGGEKMYIELNSATHFAPNTNNTTIAKYSIAWLKRWVDNDTRYTQFLCPTPTSWLYIEESASTCGF